MISPRLTVLQYVFQTFYSQDLTQLLKCKKECLSGPTTNTAEDPALYEEQDHLVL